MNIKKNLSMKEVVSRVKSAQTQLQSLIQSQDWVEEARKYAERQGKEVRKLLSGDVSKVKTFLEHERKELERFQKQIPGEVKKVRKFVAGQRKEFEKLLDNVRKASSNSGAKTSKPRRKKAASSARKTPVAAAPAASAPASTVSAQT